MQFPDASQWFKPLWVRVLVTLGVAGWSAFEWLVNKEPFWGMLTLGMLGWAIHTFFIAKGKTPGDGPKA